MPLSCVGSLRMAANSGRFGLLVVSVAATAQPPQPPRMAAECGLSLPSALCAAVLVVLCCCAPLVWCAAVLVGLRSSRKASALRAVQATAPPNKTTFKAVGVVPWVALRLSWSCVPLSWSACGAAAKRLHSEPSKPPPPKPKPPNDNKRHH